MKYSPISTRAATEPPLETILLCHDKIDYTSFQKKSKLLRYSSKSKLLSFYLKMKDFTIVI